ncbi:MAG: 30S ribosomal protein S16 [Candidatus Portnoybacteria bacterium CG10_big_fil_rev_8_21_14_0_10_40_22]|uniref:Small ribosomal subunit protein bS16 n=3 Tax=Candidatus Portnoyibacteriota TaxID=1817913 RepID=A0A2M8KGJ0_9BACT|nr:MAG: 30S ribosomal protein S16 [Parcubacteria group bacterium CG1_02_40_25]PIZ70976.1 MAG: 30S ribosomal protein S16 [Candidatus Portnoybacteria bacterium CG_4_10_14_0_2_um_filter_39_11]PJE59030.1 MAG: 30S ribosomal protein S16 [Candidatus Portnoybacteria bacterium CG10_big_fil_rev_8_21_14_0_10_40_22]
MLSIRLHKVGKKNQPYYRLVVCEKKTSAQGKYLELLGSYNPRSKEIKLEKERILHWLKNGAQPSATVNNMLIKQGMVKGAKQKVWYNHEKDEAKKAEEAIKVAATAILQAPAEVKPEV